MPHHIYDELEGKRREEREEKCAIRDGCNTDYDKRECKKKDKLNIKGAVHLYC